MRYFLCLNFVVVLTYRLVTLCLYEIDPLSLKED